MLGIYIPFHPTDARSLIDLSSLNCHASSRAAHAQSDCYFSSRHLHAHLCVNRIKLQAAKVELSLHLLAKFSARKIEADADADVDAEMDAESEVEIEVHWSGKEACQKVNKKAVAQLNRPPKTPTQPQRV